MPYITRPKHIKRRGIHILVLIIGYNGHYIYFKKVITQIPLYYKHTTLKEYKYITLKNHLKIILRFKTFIEGLLNFRINNN